MATYTITATSASTGTVMREYGAQGQIEYLSLEEAEARGAEWVAMLNREAEPKDYVLTVGQAS